MTDVTHKSLAIGILARDCADAVVRNKVRIEQLRQLFGVSYVVAVENDSKDRTREELLRYASESEGVTVISHNLEGKVAFHFDEVPARPDMACQRIARMSYVRNLLLEHILDSYNCDYVMFLDIDVQDFSVQGIVDAIGNAPSDWGALFANGREFIQWGSRHIPSVAQYDTYAMLFEGERIADMPLSLTRPLTKLLRGMSLNRQLADSPYVGMASAFGGIGIYRTESLPGVRYGIHVPDAWKGKGISVCEHIPFNMQVRGRCYVARSMQVKYHTDTLSNPANDLKRKFLLLFFIIKHLIS